MRRTALLLDSYFEGHVTGYGHPESPRRYRWVSDALDRTGLLDDAPRVERRKATTDELLRCHSATYLATVQADVAGGERNLSTGDTAIGPSSLAVALEAAGGVLNAVDTVLSGSAANAFCAVRPPGHHATRHRGMGFCIFNNVALAALHARQAHGVARVLIVDWDVHHGNGTQDLFYQDPGVFFFSTHQYPWYPGTGASRETGDGAGKNTTLNCPLASGAGRPEVMDAFVRKLKPAADAYRPELILISAGFDSRGGDPLGRLTLTDRDFADLTGLVLEIADEHAGGRLVSVLEGGYDPVGLASGVEAHVTSLAGLPHRKAVA
jgi:acetoin utilization deacetylase AcuC-like enzyme